MRAFLIKTHKNPKGWDTNRIGGNNYAYCEHYCLYPCDYRRVELGAFRLFQFQSRIYDFRRPACGWFGYRIHVDCAVGNLAYHLAFYDERQIVSLQRNRKISLSENKEDGFLCICRKICLFLYYKG